MSNFHDPAKGACRPMVPLIKAMSEGKLKGPMQWYAKSHVAQCPRCRAAFEASEACRLGAPDSVETDLPLKEPA